MAKVFSCSSLPQVPTTKPELVMDTFLRWMGEEPLPFAYMIERREIYANKGDEEHLKLVSMEALGEKVE
mgnify:CR=1 FL=1